jgi:hypothetical protein
MLDEEAGKMKEMTSQEREKIEVELQGRHGDAIMALSSELYEKEPAAIGIAISYFDCRCVLLWGFDKSGDITGDPEVIDSADSCSKNHVKVFKKGHEAAAYNTIHWKDTPEEFDRKFGNEQRIIIASRLFPPREEE